MTVHPIAPVYDENSRVLILGSFPSVKSRECGFFYAHSANRFWKLMAEVFCVPLPKTVEEKIAFLKSNNIALWDVIASCEIKGSSDSSIREVTTNDISQILDNADIKQIFVNGKTAQKYYNKYIKSSVGRDAICLPSTSAANASSSFASLFDEWKIIRGIAQQIQY